MISSTGCPRQSPVSTHETFDVGQGELVPAISQVTGVLANTIHKAIRAGRLRPATKKKNPPPSA